MSSSSKENPALPPPSVSLDSKEVRPNRLPVAGAAPYIPIHSFRTGCRGIAPPVTIRAATPVFSAPPRPRPQRLPSPAAPPIGIAPPVCIRQAVPVFAASPARRVDASHPAPAPISPVQKEPQVTTTIATVEKESPSQRVISLATSDESVPHVEEGVDNNAAGKNEVESDVAVVAVLQDMKELKI